MTKQEKMNKRDILKLLNRWSTYNSLVSATLVYFLIFGFQYFVEFGGYGTVILISTLGLPILGVVVLVAIYAIISLFQSFRSSQIGKSKLPTIVSISLFILAILLPKFDYNFEKNVIMKRTDALNRIASLAKDKELKHNPKYKFRRDAVMIPKEFGTLAEYDCFVSHSPTLMVEISPRNPYWTITFVEDTAKWIKRSDEISRKNIKDNWFVVKYDFN